MDTLQVSHNQVSNDARRKIVDTWTAPDNYRVKLHTYHDKNTKVYRSIISECLVRESGTDGIYFEYSSPMSDLHQIAHQAIGNRYSYLKLSENHALALASVQELIRTLLDSHH